MKVGMLLCLGYRHLYKLGSFITFQLNISIYSAVLGIVMHIPYITMEPIECLENFGGLEEIWCFRSVLEYFKSLLIHITVPTYISEFIAFLAVHVVAVIVAVAARCGYLLCRRMAETGNDRWPARELTVPFALMST